jgi:chemotaxis protein MotA
MGMRRSEKVNTSLIGLLLSLAIAGWSVAISAKDPTVFLNIHSIVLVIGGTFTVGLLAYKPSELKNLFFVALKILKRDEYSSELAVKQLVEISKNAKNTPRLAEKYATAHPFITDGLRLIDNEFSGDDIEEIMATMLMERKHEFSREIEIVNTLAKYPPAFGMVGTVLGLVAMLGSITVDSNVSTIGPSMAISLATTFYGLLLSNYFLSPVADCLANRLRSEMTQRRIIIKGILLISDKQDAVFIEEALNAHMLPSHRTTARSPTRARA